MKKIANEDGENAEILNFDVFLQNAVKNLKIPEYQKADPLATYTFHLEFRIIKNLNNGSKFNFTRVKKMSVEDIVR